MALEAAASKKPLKETTPRVDFRGTAEEDVRLRRIGLRELWRQAECVGAQLVGSRQRPSSASLLPPAALDLAPIPLMRSPPDLVRIWSDKN